MIDVSSVLNCTLQVKYPSSEMLGGSGVSDFFFQILEYLHIQRGILEVGPLSHSHRNT